MVHRENLDQAVLDPIHNPVAGEDDLADQGIIDFGNDSAQIGEGGKSVDGGKHVDDEEAGIARGVRGYEVGNALKIICCLRRLSHFSHLAIFSFA